MKNVALMLVFYLGSSGILSAGPDNSTLALMKNTVSVLEWGLLRIEIRIDDWMSDSDFNHRASYSWDDDEILIDAKMHPNITSMNYPRRKAEDVCRDEIESLRNSAGVFPDDQVLGENPSHFSRAFTHKEFDWLEKTQNIDEWLIEIDRKIRLRVIQPLLLENEIKFMLCEAKLFDTGISVEMR